jgi:hypothetical protein
MGGVGAWKEKEKEQKGFRQKWDREELEVERSRREGEDGDQGHGEYNTYDNGNDAITSGEGESQDESIAGLDDDVSLDSPEVRDKLIRSSRSQWI